MFKGALFDLDGVIADTSVYHFAAWQKLAQDHFDFELPATLEEKTKGVSRGDSLQVILDFIGAEVTKEQFVDLAQEKNEVYLTYLEQLTPDNILPGIASLIAELQAHGVKLALASASLNAPLILEKLGLEEAFEVIADPTAGAGKPAPDIFLNAAAGLQLLPEECVGLEDSLAGIAAINRANIFSVGIGSADQLSAADLLFNDTTEITYQKMAQAFIQTN